MQWTQEQEKVIRSHNRNLLVSAAAGSGKTAVLVERIVRMVTEGPDPVDLDRLLVMTFTNAAAAEMRERIGRAIRKKLSEDGDNARLRLQAALVPHAQIQTIDSFCLSLIRSHYASLDIDPAFRVGDEGELTLLRADVMGELFEDQYQEATPEFVRFVETYGGGKTDQGIEETVEQVYRFAVSHPWPEKWLEQCRQEFASPEEFSESGWIKFLLGDVRMQMAEFVSQMEEAMAICQEPDGPAGYLPNLRDERDMLEAIGQAGDFKTLQARLEALSFGRLSPARKKEIDPEKKEQVTSIRDRVKKAAVKCRDQYASLTEEEIKASMAGCAPAVEELLILAGEFMGRYQQAKKERNLVDFADLEHYALEVLYEDGKPSAVADRLSRKYQEILVDEYQDSNQVQETLIAALSRERYGEPDVFMVGDMKQSIYRFRQARPELFLEKYKAYSLEEGPFQKIELQMNFRSRPEVLESTNAVFYKIMGSCLGGIDYTAENALYPGGQFPLLPAPQNNGTELFVVNTGKEELAGLDEEARDYTSREIEVKLAVEKIRQLTDPETGLMIWDKEKEAYRRARYGDVVILLRSISGWAEAFVNGLMNEGIPAYAQSQSGYFDTTEIETMLSLLAVIDNPIQDIPLAAVMRSPILGMTDTELAWMTAVYKRHAKKDQDRGIYGAWQFWMAERPWEESMTGAEMSLAAEQYGEETERQWAAEQSGEDALHVEAGAFAENVRCLAPEDLYQEIGRKLEKLSSLLSHFRRLSAILPIHQLLEEIYRDTGYYAWVSAMPSGETRQANLDLLIEKAAAYESTSYQGLFHFIRYIEKLKKVDTDFGEAALAGGEDRTVRIMSIHKSKGLEFPIVILAGMGKKFNKKDAYSRLLIDPDLGVAADYVDLDSRLKMPTLKKQVLKRKLELEGMGEELRVLYVAMTRAREKLVMTAADPYLETKLERWGLFADESGRIRRKARLPEGTLPFTHISSAGSYLDWILMAAPEDRKVLSSSQVSAGEFLSGSLLEEAGRRLSAEALLAAGEARASAWARETAGEIVGAAAGKGAGAAAGDSSESSENGESSESSESIEYRKRLEEALHYQYPHKADISLYAMLSVSEIKRQSQEDEWAGAAHLFAGEMLEPEQAEAETLENEPELPTLHFNGGAARGTAYHRMLQKLPFSRCRSFRQVTEEMDRLVQEGKVSKKERRLTDSAVLWAFFQSPLGKRLAEAEEKGLLYKETQFMVGIPARQMGIADSDELVLVQGMIDVYAKEEDGILLVDYKTDRVESEQELLERYGLQVRYYARALEQLTGEKVKEAILYSLRLQKEIPVPGLSW